MHQTSNATCTLINNENSYRIENFESIGPDTRVVLSMNVETPHS